MNLKVVREALARQYGTGDVGLQLLVQTEEKSACRVNHADGRAWVLRMYPEAAETSVRNQALVLEFLEQHAYPASRLVRSHDGAALTAACGGWMLLTTFIPGATCDFVPDRLRLLGAALGRLHALGARADVTGLPAAGMRPRNELAWGLSQLRDTKDRVPPNLRARYATIEAALLAIDLCEDLAPVLIHNDCHPYNAIRTPGGEVVLVDWEGAGLAPAVIDVGFALHSCDRGTLLDPDLPADPRRIEALVEGYCRHHWLDARELSRLADMIRFRALVYGACVFEDEVADDHGTDEEALWWRRFLAADELAARATEHFERLRAATRRDE